MIVVDSNVVAYLFLSGDHTPQARRVFQKDPTWVAPLLWRSEFRSVLGSYLRQGALALADACQLMRTAEQLFHGAEYQVDSARILDLLKRSRCSAYDCEFVALAQELGISLVTSDAAILAEFAPPAVSLDVYGR